MEKTIADIEATLAMIRPVFQRDRGDIEFVRFVPEMGRVEVRMHGMCRGCGMADFTLKMVVEETLREHVTEVREVVAVD